MNKRNKKKTQQNARPARRAAANRTYKDTIFRMLFREKENLLELYNAISEKHYTDPNALEVITLENAVYLGVKNDLAFLLDLNLHLYEHQSTVNPNIPYRFLDYTAEEFGRLTADENLYGTRPIPLPAPHFLVFYNGESPQPERQILCLSDLYQTREEEPMLELQVLVLNINEGYNTQIKEQCRTLRDYMEYVNRVRRYRKSLPLQEAIDRAVDECIQEGIMKKFLKENKAQVRFRSLYEFDEKAYKKALREEAYEDGLAEGKAAGMAEGIAEGMAAGMAKGVAAGKAESVIELLEFLAPVPEEVRAEILAQKDSSVLKNWHLQAARAKSLEEWREIALSKKVE